MCLALIALEETGVKTANRIINEYSENTNLFLPQKFKNREHNACIYSESLGALVTGIFNRYDKIAFIMAMGIVVRVIAPHIKDKYTDPAVVVIDDVGRYVISMLSGHEGGANDLAFKIANILHTEAIITTGSEARKDVIVGVGCKKNVRAEDIKTAIKSALADVNIDLDRIRLLATIDLKANEKGLVDASNDLNIPLRIVSRNEIDACLLDYEKSDFVKEKIGIGAVCEPAAVLGGRKTKLILKKQKFPGITIAVAVENFTW